MNKKILTSLLVSPLAFGAWADIPYESNLQNSTGWSQSGISGSDIFSGENGVQCPIQGGYIYREINLLPGTYKFTFTGAENVELLLGDKAIDLTDGTATYTVTGQSASKVVLKIQSSNDNGFAFTSFNITLDFDFTQAAEALTASLPTIDELKDAAGAPADVKTSITAAKTELTRIKGLIATLTGSDQKGAYETNEMWNYPETDAITTAIEALTSTVKNVNASIEEANDAYDKKVANDNANTENMSLVNRLQITLDGVDTKFEEAINAVSDDQPNKDLVTAYAESIRKTETDNLQAKIDTFKAEVEDAFSAGESVARAEEFNNTFNTISSALGEYRSEVVATGGIACINDAEAYFQIRLLLDKTNSAAMTASLDLNKLQGVEGYENAFETLRNEWVNTGLPAVYTDYLTTLSGFAPVAAGSTLTPELSEAIEGAAKNLDAATDAYKSATDAISTFVTAKTDLVKAQNDLMTEDLKAIDAIEIPTATASLPQKLKDEITAQATAKTNLKTSVETAYTTLSLQPENYEPTLAAINTAVENLNKEMEAYQSLEAKIADIDKAYTALETKVQEVNKDGSVINGQFAGTMTSIASSIGALKGMTPGDDADALVAQINKAIEETNTNVDNLLKANTSATENLAKYKSNLDTLNNNLNGTGFKTFTGVKPATTGLTADQEKAYNDLKAEYDAISGDPQAIYTALTALSNKLANGLEAFENASAAILSNYANAVAAANKKYVDGTYTATETLWNGMETYFGKDTLETQLQGFKSTLDAIGTTVTGENVIDAANAIYDKLKTVNDDLTGLQPDIADYQANQTWYNNQTAGLEGLDKTLTEASATNGKTSWTPALEYFAGVIDTDTESLTKLEADLKAALEKGIANGNISDKDKSALEERVSDIVAEINGLDQRIKENQGAYTGLLAESESTREAIQKAENRLNELNEGNDLDTDAIKAWQDSIAEYQTELIAINEKLAQAYSNGAAYRNKSNISGEYSTLKGKAENLLSDIEKDYGDEVSTANNEWASKWSTIYENLRKDYTDAIDTFNGYGSANITNSEFYDYLKTNVPVLGDHEPIYKYSALITKLNTSIIGKVGYIAQQNEAKHVITETEWNENAVAPADELSAGMTEVVGDMQTKATEAANTYFNQLVSAAEAEIDEAETKMKEAGIDSDIITDALKDAKDFIQTQKGYLDDAADKVLAVNHIANEFESFSSTIDLDAAARAEWTRAYGDDINEVEAAEATVASYTYIKAGNENLAAFNEATDAVKAMTAPAGIDGLKDKLDELDGYMETVRNASKALETENEALEQADQTTGTLKDAADKLEEDYKALQKLADGLAAGMPANTIESQIEAIKNAISTSDDIVADESSIDSMIDAANAAVDAARLALVKNENQALNDLMYNVRQAYNDARAAGRLGEDEDANKVNEYVDKLQTRVADLYNSVVTDGSLNADADLDAFKAGAQELEKEVADELLNLQSLTSNENKETSMTQALTEINEVYETVYGDVTKAKDGLSDLISEKYAPKYQALLDELTNISDEVQQAGASIVLYKDQYKEDINTVADKLKDLNAEAGTALTVAEEKKAIEETTADNAEALNADLDKVRNELDAAKAQVEQWKVTEWLNYLNSLDSRIADIEAEITAQSTISDENPDGLTNEEKDDISGMIATVPVQIDYYLEMAANQYAEEANQAARSAISDAIKALKDSNVVNSTVITEDINKQDAALEDAFNECMTAVGETDDIEDKIAAYEAFAAKAAAVEAEIAKIRETITANTYVPGDIDGSGEPDAADVQTLVGWVGSGMTYADIADKYGEAIAAAADVNGSSELNISDVTALIDLISTEPGQRPMRMYAPRNAESDASFALQRTGELDGNRVYSLSLYNSDVFIGAQVDINLPVGMTLVDARLTGRAGNHMLQVFDNGNGNYRLVIFSMDNSAFSGNSGELVNLTIEGIGNPEAVEMILSTPRHASITGKEAGTTMLESIIEDARNVKDRIYNAAGQSLRAVQRGINLIRHSDGTTSKEMHK